MSTFAFMKSIRFAILLTLLILPSLCHAQDWGMDPEWESMMRVYVKQSFNLEGKVYGTDQYEPNPYPLQGANIRMNCVADTALMDGMAAGKDGEFWVSLWSRSRLKDTRVHIIISYLGMEPLDTIVQPEKKVEDGIDTYSISMDSITLHSTPLTTQEVEIVAELQRMYQHGDTVIFNAGAYEMPTGSVLLDLVRRLPGLKYEDGQMTYLGRSIEEIRLNGDNFFKRDMSIALNNMPTDKLKSLKVYEVPDDTLNVMSDNHLIMDMETTEPMELAVFGNVAASTTREFNHYGLNLDASEWKEGKGSIYSSFQTSDIPDSYSHQLETKHTYGSIYLEKEWKKVSLSADADYNSNHNRDKSKSLDKTFMPEYTQNSTSLSESSNDGRNWSGSANAYGTINEHNSWNAGMNLSRNHSVSSSMNSDTISNDGEGLVSSTSQSNESESDGSNYSLNGSYNYSFGADNAYRLNVYASYSHSSNENTGDDISQNRFYQLGDSVRTIRHRIFSPTDNDSYTASVRFQRDYKELGWLGINYNFNYNKGESSRSYKDILSDGQLQDVDSLNYDRRNSTLNNSVSMNYWRSDSVTRIDVSATARPTVMKIDNEQAGKEEHLKQDGVEYNVNANLRIKVFKLSQLAFGYNGSNSIPSVSQLSSITDYSDPMNIRDGNSSLKNSFNHNFRLEYQLKSWMRTSVSYGLNRNQISTLTVLDRETGIRHTSPANINGNWNMNESMFLTYPFKDLSLSLNVNHSFSHNVSFVQSYTDSKPSTSATDYHNLSCRLNTAYSDRNWMLSANAGYSMDRSKSDYLTTASGGRHISANASVEYNFDFGMEISTDCNLDKPFGYEMEAANRTECIWNIQAGYEFLKKRQASIRLSWRDILHSYNGFNASMSNTNWHESITYGETSMFVITLSYRFNSFD